MSVVDFLNDIGEWILSNFDKVLFSVIAVIVGYALYKVIAREIRTLKNQKRLEEHLAYTLTRVVKWVAGLAVLSIILATFGVTLGVISGLLALLGGTIIGFAAINTIGNAIAGLIVMTSRPFRVGDRIFFNSQFADIVAIELIYTKMLTLDNVLVSVPNQELLKAEIDNFGKKRVIRRHVTVTPGFEYDNRDVEKALLEAAEKTPRVLKEPKPYVWITKFQNYAVEYTLYAFVNDIKGLPEIDAELHRTVFETCKRHKIDISTPLLLRQIQD
ncbi:MAG: mechanosensitive ion channel [Candidatus Bathyarchaeota archaeon]|nr:mechanosensitive ion channel [Candidatus Bathyarchaeota archaeon]MDH5636097.1 mechanosensitive ion channel [Candidatus Bathyarchaeota archaeon]MDH5701385.1 mechanosensitive ion channel [Candidatus Bathyarchaeota archaeon]